KQESEKRARKQLQKPTPALLPQSPSLCTRPTSAATNRKTENITSSPRVFKSEIFLIQVIKNSRGGPVHGGTRSAILGGIVPSRPRCYLTRATSRRSFANRPGRQ